LWRARRRAARCDARAAPWLSKSAALDRLVVERRYIGEGYGRPTPWGDRATKLASAASGEGETPLALALDATYTAKSFSAALDLVEARRARTILFWQTLSSAPLEPLARGAPEEGEIDPRLRRLLLS
jgi:hypothetical protein